MTFTATDGQVCPSWHQQPIDTREQFWQLDGIAA